METINKTAAAVNRILRITQHNRGGTLRLIGTVTTEKVGLYQPAVVKGEDVTDYDPNNAEHWTQVVDDGTAMELSATQTVMGLPFTGVFLVKKSVGVSSNAFGVEYV